MCTSLVRACWLGSVWRKRFGKDRATSNRSWWTTRGTSLAALAGCLAAVHAAVADQSGLPLTIETVPYALKVVVYDGVVVGSVAAHP